MKLTSGKILRGLMDQRQVSNLDVAMAAGVGRTFISALVNERRTSCKPKTAENIARYLQVPLAILFVEMASTDGGRSGDEELLSA